jgi:putative transposase
MRGKRYTEEQIIGILKEAEARVKLDEFCRKYGMSDCTSYNWKAKYGGLTISEARRLKSLEDENGRLKRMVADQALDMQVLKAVIEKNALKAGSGGVYSAALWAKLKKVMPGYVLCAFQLQLCGNQEAG